MKRNRFSLAVSLAAASGLVAQANLVAHFPMDVRSGQIQEVVSGNRFAVQGHFAPENLPGAEGEALRFDGYTSYVDARLNDILPPGTKQMTVSLWAAIPSYPIVKIDQETTEMTAIATCLDDNAKSGFGFYIGFDGKWSFKTYVSGWPLEVKIQTPLPVYQWNNLVAVVDCDARTLTVYNNGEAVGSARCSGTVTFSGGSFKMGRGELENYSGPFLLTSYNGLLDEVKIWNEALTAETIKSWSPANPANLDIPASRFENDVLRPRFHGMPAAAWTNECHGMVYADGRFHLFFQKNADGPYMARLHWGHISSENLYDWREEPIAIAPGNPYDIKGCWSGCVFTDQEITGGKPNILYTAVDYAKATIAGAAPVDNQLMKWEKWSNNPVINGRPGGLSDDFRDPYFFRNGDKAYIIVGSSKNGIGTTTLHRYDPSTKSWSNDGATFFSGRSVAADGRFWEMPNITPMAGGKWLFTATPLETSTGVKTIYWTGTINNDGTFSADAGFSTGKMVEMASRDGYGLLSPTIYNHQGTTIALGIVPDKLPSEDNWNLGWAHCYSLPREWSLDSDGSLIQKPYAGLEGMRSATSFSKDNFELSGDMSMSPVSGRAVEICGRFTLGSVPFGFRIFKNSMASASVTVRPASGDIQFDFSRLERLVNDGGVYNGVYTLPVPGGLRSGQELKINLFIDHSIIDVFINDRYASSIRVFPTAVDADGIEAFAAGGTVLVKELRGWTLDAAGGSGVENIWSDRADESRSVNVYNMSGEMERSGVIASEALADLPSGMYIVGDRKVYKP